MASQHRRSHHHQLPHQPQHTCPTGKARHHNTQPPPHRKPTFHPRQKVSASPRLPPRPAAQPSTVQHNTAQHCAQQKSHHIGPGPCSVEPRHPGEIGKAPRQILWPATSTPPDTHALRLHRICRIFLRGRVVGRAREAKQRISFGGERGVGGVWAHDVTVPLPSPRKSCGGAYSSASRKCLFLGGRGGKWMGSE